MQNHFTIAVDTCNQEKWIEKCLNTCVTQRYYNFDVIIVDAISTDKTFEICKQFEQDFKNVKAHQNQVRFPQVANFIELTKLAKPDSIIVSVDGDDWLKHSNVLNKLNEVYNSGDVWMTYGLYAEYSGDNKPLRDVSWHYQPYPDEIIKNNSFREYKWLASHLRTWKKELALKIKESDLKTEKGEWFFTTGDQAIMLGMLEMAGERSRFIPEVLYVYNVADAGRDTALNEARQIELANYIRSKSKYSRIDSL